MALIRRGLVIIDYLARLGTKDTYKAKYEALVAAIDNAPEVDAEPVRHGRWIQVITVPSYHYCSYCKSTHKMTMSCNKYVLLQYCPNCGANMDGGD